MQNEYEVVSSGQIKYVTILFNKIKYRAPHMHREFELIYNAAGLTEYHVGKDSKIFEAGSFLLFNPNQLHEIISVDQKSFMICIQIAPEFFANVFPNIHHLEFDTYDSSKVDAGAITQLVPILANAYLAQTPFYELKCSALIQEIFYELLQVFPHHLTSTAEKRTNEEKALRLERILDYAADHFNGKINLADLAAQENLSLNYLSRFIKQNLNRSFQEYIGELRFNQAKYMIRNTNENLISICEACGYSDYRYLYDEFMNHCHCSPKDYRRKHEKNISVIPAHDNSQEDILDIKQALETLHYLKN